MVDLVEDIPRLEISQLRNLNAWPALTEAGAARVTFGFEGVEAIVLDVPLVQEPPGALKRRWWFKCPSCSARCRHLYLHQDELACRSCHGLLYYQQVLPARWREEVGIPILRAWRQQSGKSVLPRAS